MESGTVFRGKPDAGRADANGSVIDAGTLDDAGFFQCDPNQVKGATCPIDGFTCKKNCGPTHSGGRKTETCVAGVFVEGTCTFPPGDYTCYKLEGTTPECTTVNDGVPVIATDPCDLAKVGTCRPCTGYMDSKGTPKEGYCHCSLSPNLDPTNAKWTCGSAGKEWPCNPDGTPVTEGITGCD